MIDWKRTKKETGFDKDYFDKFSQSHKLIYRICDECNNIQWIPYQTYSNVKNPNLCSSCSQRGNKNPMFGRTGKDSSNYGISHTDKFKSIISNVHKNKIVSLETRIKSACTKQGINREDFGGFVSKQKYCIKFNESLKTKIRNKYNNCDYLTGIHKDICNEEKNLSVHHVNYNKNCGCDGSRCELIPLSKSNHGKTNINRQFWNRLFIYALEYDKTYYNDSINIWEMI